MQTPEELQSLYIYEKGGMRLDGLNEEAQLQIEEDYQICISRSESALKLKTHKVKKVSDNT